MRAAGEGIKDIHDCVLGVDLTKNFEHATIAAAKREGNHFYTELVASLTAPTEEQLAEFIYELYKKSGASAVTLDDRYAHSLKRRLERLGLEVWPLWAKEINTACATVYQMFANQRVSHANDPLLVMQNPRAMTRYYGESWQISRKESLGDIDAILATVFALYVATARQESGIGVF